MRGISRQGARVDGEFGHAVAPIGKHQEAYVTAIGPYHDRVRHERSKCLQRSQAQGAGGHAGAGCQFEIVACPTLEPKSRLGMRRIDETQKISRDKETVSIECGSGRDGIPPVARRYVGAPKERFELVVPADQFELQGRGSGPRRCPVH